MTLKSLNIFGYIAGYRKFLKAYFKRSDAVRGERSRLADALGCRLAFISLVLAERAHFSSEHAVAAADFFGFSASETEYFLSLVQYDRAGSKRLEDYWAAKIRAVQEERRRISARVEGAARTLSSEMQTTYYSHWMYVAIHFAAMNPKLQTREAIAEFLGLPVRNVAEALSFLIAHGLVVEEGRGFRVGVTRTHLAHDSPLIDRHHLNWRLQAMASLDRPLANDLHYSSVVSVSESAMEKIREMLVELIHDADTHIMAAKDETMYAWNIDLYSLDFQKRRRG